MKKLKTATERANNYFNDCSIELRNNKNNSILIKQLTKQLEDPDGSSKEFILRLLSECVYASVISDDMRLEALGRKIRGELQDE